MSSRGESRTSEHGGKLCGRDGLRCDPVVACIWTELDFDEAGPEIKITIPVAVDHYPSRACGLLSVMTKFLKMFTTS
jgi:hypothetical protein